MPPTGDPNNLVQSPDPDASKTSTSTTAAAAAATAAPATTTTTATSTTPSAAQDAAGRQPSAAASSSSELARTKISLYGAVRRFPDFPIPGINFIDIMPWFRDPAVHATLLRALELQVLDFVGVADTDRPDVIVGLDARGFLFGPALALRLGAAFVPVRKKGKLPGPCVTAAYEKEYGTDYFQMQEDAIQPGQKVLVVDDIIATGGSAAAAGELVNQLGGQLVGYLFILEIGFLKGRDKLGGKRVITLLEEAEA